MCIAKVNLEYSIIDKINLNVLLFNYPEEGMRKGFSNAFVLDRQVRIECTTYVSVLRMRPLSRIMGKGIQFP